MVIYPEILISYTPEDKKDRVSLELQQVIESSTRAMVSANPMISESELQIHANKILRVRGLPVSATVSMTNETHKE